MQILAKSVVDVQITNNLVKGTGGTHLISKSMWDHFLQIFPLGKSFYMMDVSQLKRQKFNKILQTTTEVSEPVVRRCSVKKVFLKVSQISQESTCASLFFYKVASLSPATLLKKRLWHRCFTVNFAKFLKRSFL